MRPTEEMGGRREVMAAYLDEFRQGAIDRVGALADDERRRSRLASGWTPLELLNHLAHVERRWLEWGFLGLPVAEPWGDWLDGRWHVDPSLDFASLAARLAERGAVTREIVAGHDLDEVGRPSERWNGEPAPTLERILFHLIQEYARHLGHLDIVVELAGGPTGEA